MEMDNDEEISEIRDLDEEHCLINRTFYIDTVLPNTYHFMFEMRKNGELQAQWGQLIALMGARRMFENRQKTYDLVVSTGKLMFNWKFPPADECVSGTVDG